MSVIGIQSFSRPRVALTRGTLKQGPLTQAYSSGKGDGFRRCSGGLRFTGNQALSDLQGLLTRLKSDYSLTDHQFRQSTMAQVQDISDPALRQGLLNFLEKLRPFFIDIPECLSDRCHNKKAFRYIHALAESIAVIPDEAVRKQMMDSMITNTGNTFPFGYLREAATRAVLTMEDSDDRNQLIEKACQASGWFARWAAVGLIPFHTNLEEQARLFDRMIYDDEPHVRNKANQLLEALQSGNQRKQTKLLQELIHPNQVMITPQATHALGLASGLALKGKSAEPLLQLGKHAGNAQSIQQAFFRSGRNLL